MTMPTLMNCPHSGDGWCLDCVKSLCDENLLLHQRLADPQKIVAEYEQGKGALVEVKHWAVKLIAASLADSLGDAPNFMTGQITVNSEQGPLIFTIQRKHGRSPAEVLGDLRDALADIHETVTQADCAWQEVCQYVAKTAAEALGEKEDAGHPRVHESSGAGQDNLTVCRREGLDGSSCGEAETHAGQQGDHCGATCKEQVRTQGTPPPEKAIRPLSQQGLVKAIDIAIQLFEVNREVADSQLVKLVEKLLADIKSTHPKLSEDLAKLLHIDPKTMHVIVDGVDRFVQVENTILANNVDKTIVAALHNLKSRPVILRLLAALI